MARSKTKVVTKSAREDVSLIGRRFALPLTSNNPLMPAILVKSHEDIHSMYPLGHAGWVRDSKTSRQFPTDEDMVMTRHGFWMQMWAI